MSEQNTEELLSQAQKDKMLRDIHRSLVGSPLDPTAPPGLIATSRKHEMTLYGPDGQGGLRADSIKFRRMLWMGGGIGACITFLLGLFEFWKTISGH